MSITFIESDLEIKIQLEIVWEFFTALYWKFAQCDRQGQVSTFFVCSATDLSCWLLLSVRVTIYTNDQNCQILSKNYEEA